MAKLAIIPRQEQAETAYDLTGSGRFLSPETEKRFRLNMLQADSTRSRITIAVLLLFSTLLIPVDFALLQGSTLTAMIAVRLALLAGGAVVLLWLRRVQNESTYDRISLVWNSLVAVFMVYAGSTRPPTQPVHYAADILVVYAMYLNFRSGVLFEFFPPALLSLLVLIWAAVTPGAANLGTIFVVNLGAHVIGLFSSRDLHQRSRLGFAALERESKLRQRLEGALAEIKTLEGILPICSHCKQVRDAEGQWHHVESYVREHSNADFSHSICPTCRDAEYGELLARSGD